MPERHKEGRIYKTVTVEDVIFEIRYGYYEEFERARGEPVPIYPDFIKNPKYAKDGRPFVTAMQDICPHFVGEEGSLGCHGCKYYEAGDDLVGLCNCEHNRRSE